MQSQPEALWPQVRRVTATALECGAAQPIPTELRTIEDGGVRFLIRIATTPSRKPTSSEKPPSKIGSARGVNPFLPYDPALYVSDIGPDHICLLNKYNVVDHHVLIVSRTFQAQSELLGKRDFWALSHCLAEYDSLGFHNSGAVAGASQPHRHLQLIPLPLVDSPSKLPLEPLFLEAFDRPGMSRTRQNAVQSDRLSFPHRLARFDESMFASPADAADLIHVIYRAMLSDLNLDTVKPCPYNLLVSRRWMLMVPRLREYFQSISLNSLAFAGVFFVRHREYYDQLTDAGPFQALRQVTRKSD